MIKFLTFIWETAKIVIISLAIIIPVRYFLVQPFFVQGASMIPAFSDGEYLIVDEISYRFHNPERGEVVVFEFPKDPSQYYIKRIIGLPLETVEIKDGKVFIYNQENPQGKMLQEGYLPEGLFTNGKARVELSDDEYFVLGDNRQASSDSRSWGAIEEDDIIGRVWVRAWPFDVIKIY